MEGALKRRGVKKKNYKLLKINKINNIQKFYIINAILHRSKIKYFKGTNFRGIDFLVFLREMFVQVLIFMYFTPKVIATGIFLINGTPSVRWNLLEGGS